MIEDSDLRLLEAGVATRDLEAIANVVSRLRRNLLSCPYKCYNSTEVVMVAETVGVINAIRFVARPIETIPHRFVPAECEQQELKRVMCIQTLSMGVFGVVPP